MPLINQYEYDYLTNSYNYGKGAALNAVAEFCYEEGLVQDLPHTGKVFLTPKGVGAVLEYEEWSKDNELDNK